MSVRIMPVFLCAGGAGYNLLTVRRAGVEKNTAYPVLIQVICGPSVRQPLQEG
jgi:hypothetical protein